MRPDTRLIPARAGNTFFFCSFCSRCSAHPRSRGEHVMVCGQRIPPSGSSPLARGTLLYPGFREDATRLIPARAGNTHLDTRTHRPVPAHPRSRGEHVLVIAAHALHSGSSPLARGTQDSEAWIRGAIRLIPARAGNTGGDPLLHLRFAAHPRSRGEHGRVILLGGVGLGSSPLARGTHLLTWGFTPYISKIESLWSQSLHPEYTINNRS